MKNWIYNFLLRHMGRDELLKRVLQSVEWFDEYLEWTPNRKNSIMNHLAKDQYFVEYLHYIWARDRKQLFDLVGLGKQFSRDDQLIKYGAMARVASIIAQLRQADRRHDKDEVDSNSKGRDKK